MGKIISREICKSINNCSKCPYPKNVNECTVNNCLTCPTHCPCCMGSACCIDSCKQCPEEDCENRTSPYAQSKISKQEE